MKMVLKTNTMIVDVVVAPRSMPPIASSDGITTSRYAAARNDVMPASASVRTVVLRARSAKRRSSQPGGGAEAEALPGRFADGGASGALLTRLVIEDSSLINRFLLLPFDFILRRIVSIRALAMATRSSLLPALTLKQIQYFVVLAHAGSFTQAARSLSLTQPALTAAIRQIENLLGGPLFARSAHRLTLTDAGASVLPLAERLLNNARGTFDDMASTFAEQTQSVRISLIPSVAGRLLHVLAPLREREPSLRFIFEDMPNSALLEAIREGRADLGIGVHEPDGAENDDSLRYQNLLEDEIVVVIRRDDPLARRKSVDWNKLVDRELAVFVRGSVSDALRRTGMAENLRLTVAYRMEYTESLYALVRNGLAVAVLPSFYTMHLHDPELIALRLDKPRVTRAIALISLADDDRGPHVSACREWIAANF
jgi:LysR family carnitine catabolism transcriptional activator